MHRWVLLGVGLWAGCSTLNPEFDGAEGEGGSTSPLGTTGWLEPTTDGGGGSTRGSATMGTTGSSSSTTTSTGGETTESSGTTAEETSGTGGTLGSSESTESTGSASSATDEASESTAGSSESSGSSSEGETTMESSSTGCDADAWYLDRDEDGWGGEFVQVSCEVPSSGPGPYARQEGDCNDDDPGIYPGALEICGDEIDQDCEGGADDDPDCEACEPLTEDVLLCDARSWDASAQLCGRFEGRLAVAASEDQEEDLGALLEDAGVEQAWIGLSRGALGDFLWADGGLLDYENWLVPVEGTERQCASLSLAGNVLGWLAQSCAEPLPALCELLDG